MLVGRVDHTVVVVMVLVMFDTLVTVDVDTIVVVVGMVLLVLFFTLGFPMQGLTGSVRRGLPLASSPFPPTLTDGGDILSVRVRFPVGVPHEPITTMLVFPLPPDGTNIGFGLNVALTVLGKFTTDRFTFPSKPPCPNNVTLYIAGQVSPTADNLVNTTKTPGVPGIDADTLPITLADNTQITTTNTMVNNRAFLLLTSNQPVW